MKRKFSLFLAAFFTVASVMMPTYAYATYFNPIAIRTVLAAGATTEGMSLAMGARTVVGLSNPVNIALTVAQIAAYAYVHYTDSSGVDHDVSLQPNLGVVPVPAGWTYNPADPVHPSPPSTATQAPIGIATQRGLPYGGQTVAGYAIAETMQPGAWISVNWTNQGSANCPNALPSVVSASQYFCTYSNYQYSNGAWSGNSGTEVFNTYAASCPTGYSVSGSSCVVSSPTTVKYPSDSVPTLQSGSAGKWAVNPQDTDALPSALSPLIGTANPFVIQGLNSDGQLTQVTVTPTSPGGMTLQTMQQKSDPVTNQTMTQTDTYNITNGGQITNATSTTNYGSITNQSSQTVINNGTGAPVVFPTDYAKAGEAATAAGTTNAKLDILHTDITTAASDPTLSTQHADLDTAAETHKTTLIGLGAKAQDTEGGLLSWFLIQPVTQDNTCADPAFDVMTGTSMSRTITITGYCDKIAMIRQLLAWIMYILTMVVLFNIVTGSKAET